MTAKENEGRGEPSVVRRCCHSDNTKRRFGCGVQARCRCPGRLLKRQANNGRTQLEDIVTSKGGQVIPPRQDDEQIDNLDGVTHIVSTHIDFPQYNAALEDGINIVKPSWVIQSLNKGKVAQPRQHSPDPCQYFQDVVVTFGELPESDQDAIIAGVMALGGQHSSPLSKLVTHVVTTTDENEKCRIVRDRNLSCKIVLPHWFDDCFRLGRKIGERPYTFPNPELLRSDNSSKIRDFHSDHLDGATIATPSTLPSSSPPSSPSDTRKNLNALMCKKIFLSKDLQLSSHLHKTLEGLINHGGATITHSIEEAHIYIGQYREGKDYIKASRAGKEVANLSWLYHVINRNKYTRPIGKLLHYPVPREGLPGFENMRISISNYTGDARMYLENLVKHCGAEFTKTMKQDNTHLITAHTHSEKCEAAQEWGINIVNHIWLEESYAKCAVQPLTNPRYTHFPARTNLGEVAGQTSFDMKRLEQKYFTKPVESPVKPTQSTAPKAQARPSPRKTVASTNGVLADATINQTDLPTPNAADDETEDEQPQTTKKPRGRPRKSDLATPRLRDDEKENQSPLLYSSGRASKTKALGMLHQQAGDIALFQKEMKRKGGVTHGGRRSANAEDRSSPLPASPAPRKKRTSDEATYDATAMGSDLSDGETQAPPSKPAKKAKHAPTPTDLPPVQYRMMVTGDERWLNKSARESADKQKLRQLGVVLVSEPNNIDIVIAPKILRTRKFVCALANAPMVFDSTYLDYALKHNELIDEPSLLHDPETEEKYDFNLADSLARAEDNQGKLLRGWSIFVTKDVKGGFDTYKDIITANGGQALLYAGRTGVNIPKRRLRNDPEAGSESQHQGGDEEFDYVYLVSGDSEADVKLWKPFRDLAEKQGLAARIVKNDWLLHVAMSQRIEWRSKFELDESQVLSQREG